jgi:ABC-type multidrug transport system fused ATPase/permease subunit
MGESALPNSGGPQPVLLTLQAYTRLLARYLRPQILQVILMAAFLLLGIAVKLVNPQVLRYFLDTAQAGGGSSALTTAATLFIAFAVLQQGMSLATNYTAKAVGWTATNQLRADLTRHLLRLDLSFHKSRTPGELIERVDGDVTQLANFFSMFSVNILGDGLLVLGILILLFREDPGVGLGMLFYIAVTLLVLRYIQGLAVPRRAAERQAGAMLYGYIEERISGAEEIRAAGAEGHAMRRLHDLMRIFTEKTRIALVISSLTYNLTNLVYVIGYAAGLALGVYLYSQGQASLGTAYLITYYIGMLSDPLQSIRAQVQDLQQASANIQRVQELFDLQPKVADPVRGAQSLPSGALAVEFAGVSFRYEDAFPGETGRIPPYPPLKKGGQESDESQNTLSSISFTLQPGRVLGILGRTGSGKSTLTRLLFRLYDPDRGAIRLNGVDLRAVPLANLRRQVGMVTQDVQLFQASVRENLTFFNNRISDAHIQHVLEALQLWDWVQSLPQGLATPLAGGQSLSAGEAQLLAFARVFLKDPGLVILDEASSRLDPSTEALMERASDHLFAGRTGVVIAHRLKTVQRADDILILEEGRVVEAGARLTLANDPSSRFYQLLRVGLEEALV